MILLTPRLVDPADCNQMPKALPGSETRKPDDFEFYLETILEAPRGQRTIWAGHGVYSGVEVGPVGRPLSVSGWLCTAAGCPDGKCASGQQAARRSRPEAGEADQLAAGAEPPIAASDISASERPDANHQGIRTEDGGTARKK